MHDADREKLLTGTTSAPPEVHPLRAGDLSILLVDGDLRAVRRGDGELVQRVYVAVRDLDWNTLPGTMTGLHISGHDDAFTVEFTRCHRTRGVDYEWRALIQGSAAGMISYEMTGVALADFPYAKIGICVHHPITGFAGQPYRGTAPSGQVSGRLPDHIGPQVHLDDGTDLPLFEPVADLALTHESGGVVLFAFEGDLWEMEDQRNWTDASYKSVSTPARLGYRHEAQQGEVFRQRVVITAEGFAGSARPSRRGVPGGAFSGTIDLGVGQLTNLRVPPIGLGCSDPAADMSERALNVLRAIRPAHLRIDAHLSSDDLDRSLAAATELARHLGCELELAVFLPVGAGSGAPLARLRQSVLQLQPPLARMLAFHDGEESSSASTVDAVMEALAGITAAPVITGTNVYFNELNRHRVPPGRAAGLAWSVNPQVHASDELSLIENLQAQPDTLATARSFAPGTQYFITPVTLRPRFNAVASTDQEFLAGGLPCQTDPRQCSLFGAVWTLGSIAALAGAGADGVTYYDTVGPRGVIESTQGSPAPDVFPSRPDTAFPLAVVLADACALRGAALRQLRGTDPATLTALAADTGTDTVVLLGNLTRHVQQVRLQVGFGSDGRVRQLNEHTYWPTCTDPITFLSSSHAVEVTGSLVTVQLAPYGYARLDVHHD